MTRNTHLWIHRVYSLTPNQPTDDFFFVFKRKKMCKRTLEMLWEARNERRRYLEDRNLFDDRLHVCLVEYQAAVETRQRRRQAMLFHHVLQEMTVRAMAHPSLRPEPVQDHVQDHVQDVMGVLRLPAMVFLFLCMVPVLMAVMGMVLMVDGIAGMRVSSSIPVSKRRARKRLVYIKNGKHIFRRPYSKKLKRFFQ